jgi:PleD family two-component response regulator
MKSSTVHSLNLAFEYSEAILLGELLLTDCSKSNRIMLSVTIVGEDHAFRTVLRTSFQSGGFDDCIEAANASDAAGKINRLSPNLAVVDFSTPGMNGLQLARQLRGRESPIADFHGNSGLPCGN